MGAFSKTFGEFNQGTLLNLCPEYKIVLAAMPVKPSTQDVIRQNRFMKRLVDGGYFAKAEVLDVFATHDGGALINWKNPQVFKPTKIGNPVFSPYQGFCGSAFNAINMKYRPSADASILSQNNLCVIAATGTNINGGDDCGVSASGYGGIALRSLNQSYETSAFRLNSGNQIGGLSLSGVSYVAASRNNAANFDTYINKIRVNKSSLSLPLPNLEMYACAINESGTTYYGNKYVRFVFVFQYLTEAEISDIIDIMEEYLTPYHTNIFNYNEYIVKPYVRTISNVPLVTYDGSGETVHPSVINIGEAWNGYQYWMANTPYPSSNSGYENPCIWASTDGNEWVVPEGVINPIFPKPATGYNADTFLYFEENTLYMIWKEASSTSIIKMSKCNDGINWTSPITVLTQITGESECISPSLVKIGNIYYLYYFTFTGSATVNPRVLRVSCNDIDGTYNLREVVNVPDISPLIWWHPDVRFINGVFWMSCITTTSSSAGSEIFVMKSTDGINFIRSPYPTVISNQATRGMYKPSLVMIANQAVLFFSTFGANPTWSLKRINVDLK